LRLGFWERPNLGARSVDSLPALHFVLADLNPPAMPLVVRSVEAARALVLARSVNWTRLNYLNPLPAPLLVRLVYLIGTLHLVLACLAYLNPPAMPLVVRSVEAARALVLARSVNWTRLNYLNSLPAPLLVRLVYLIGTLHLVLACLAYLNPRAMPLVVRSVESVWPLVLDRSINSTRLDCVYALPSLLLARLVHSLWALYLLPVLYVDWTRRSERLNLLRCCHASAFRCPVDRVNH
jgi:hypothetical protein